MCVSSLLNIANKTSTLASVDVLTEQSDICEPFRAHSIALIRGMTYDIVV